MKSKLFALSISFTFIATIAFNACGQKREFQYRSIPKQYVLKVNHVSPQSDKGYYDITSDLPSGYVTDATVDYTHIIQNALNQYKNVKFPNFPILINDNGLELRSNSNILFNNSSKLILKGSDKGTYNIIQIHNVENVNIYNINIVGDRMTHEGQSGEWGMGIGIRSSQNINIYNAEISNCWGDGIYIGQIGGTPSTQIRIENATLDKNRRNGISITSAIGVDIINTVVSNTYGTAPMCGIDIEPNNNSDQINDIKIENPVTFNNHHSGIVIGLGKLVGQKKKMVNIKINNHIDDGSEYGFYMGGILPANEKKGSKLTGTITVTNPSWSNNYEKPLLTRRSFGRAPKLIFSNIEVVNPPNELTSDQLRRIYKGNSEIQVE